MKRKIVIVDDDREMCEEMCEILRDEGWSVRAAHNGLDGLALVEKSRCDLLLLDLKMPGLTGEQLLGRLSAGRAKPKVLIVTARLLNHEAAMEDLTKLPGWDLVEDVISKPFEIVSLIKKIRALIG